MLREVQLEGGGTELLIPPMSKGPVLDRLDRAASDTVLLAGMIDWLERYPQTPLVQMGREYGILTERWEARHLKRHAFRDWWPELQPIEPIVRAGILEALTQCRHHRLPLDSYWLCTGGPVRCIIPSSAHQVTLLIATPPPPGDGLLLDTFPDTVTVVEGERSYDL
jgi:hypothetical protein